MSSYIQGKFTKALNDFQAYNATVVAKDELIKAQLESDDPKAVRSAIKNITEIISEIEMHMKKFDSIEDRWSAYIAAVSDENAKDAEEKKRHAYMENENGADSAREHAEKLVRVFRALSTHGMGRIEVLEATARENHFSTPSQSRPTSPLHPDPHPGAGFYNSRLPFYVLKMPLPTFSGKRSEWRRFSQAFKGTVFLQNWPKSIMLSLLFSSLSGEAAESVSGFDISDENFDPVWARLEERFGDSELLRNQLLQSIGELKRPGESFRDAIAFVDRVEALIRQAEALKLSVENNESIRMSIERALPNWIESLIFPMKINEKKWDLKGLRSALDKIMKAATERDSLKLARAPREERISTMVVQTIPNTAKRMPKNPNSTNSPHKIYQSTPNSLEFDPSKCALCQKGTHKPEDCRTFSTPENRWEKVRERHLCGRCLKKHNYRSCRAVCANCGRRHHLALCAPPISTSNANSNQQRAPAHQQKFQNSTNTVNSVLAEDNENVVVFPANCRDTEIALLTGLVKLTAEANSKKRASTMAFLDCGANKSYISMKLATALNLKLGPVKQLTVKTFAGIKRMECRDSRLELVLDNQQLFSLDVLVVDQIVGRMPTATIPNGVALRPENVVKEVRDPMSFE